jgi:hypothetical protein
MRQLGLVFLFVGCASSVKEYVPVHGSSLPVRVPNQQRLVALAASQAVGNAARELNLAQYAGLSGRVEVNGVFPHSASDLLEYVTSAVEFEMARVGMRVIPHPLPLAPVRSDSSAAVVVMRDQGAEPSAPPPDLRVIASLDWGGIDFKDHTYVVWSRAGAMLGILGGGLVLGAIVIGAGANATTTISGPFPGGSREVPDDSLRLSTGIAGGTIMLLGIAVPLIWRAIDKPVGHQFTLTGRVRLNLRVIPNAAGQRPAQAVGDGESHIVIDTRSDSGYTNLIEIPEPKK